MCNLVGNRSKRNSSIGVNEFSRNCSTPVVLTRTSGKDFRVERIVRVA
jgi:hypothetical protein